MSASTQKKYPKVTARPGPVIETALVNYCKDKRRSQSAVATMALEEFLPAKYLAAARKKINGRKVRSRR